MALGKDGLSQEKGKRERIWRRAQGAYGQLFRGYGVTALPHEDTTNARRGAEPDPYPQHPETLKRPLNPFSTFTAAPLGER